MPEATILYSVTGVVIAGLVVWVVLVLAKAKQPWARPAPAESETASAEVPLAASTAPIPPSPTSDADETARQTPMALSAGREKAADVAPESDAGAKKADA